MPRCACRWFTFVRLDCPSSSLSQWQVQCPAAVPTGHLHPTGRAQTIPYFWLRAGQLPSENTALDSTYLEETGALMDLTSFLPGPLLPPVPGTWDVSPAVPSRPAPPKPEGRSSTCFLSPSFRPVCALIRAGVKYLLYIRGYLSRRLPEPNRYGTVKHRKTHAWRRPLPGADENIGAACFSLKST